MTMPGYSSGKPGGTVNVKLGLIFNHEGHEAHEENTKVEDIAPAKLRNYIVILFATKMVPRWG